MGVAKKPKKSDIDSNSKPKAPRDSKENYENLKKECLRVLAENDQGSYTQPAKNLYGHQWLWDSCFTAIGLRNVDIKRARLELESLIEGQWQNGMLPNMIFRSGEPRDLGGRAWLSKLSPFSPTKVNTSSITQPPMLAEATLKVAQKMNRVDGQEWLRKMIPAIKNYHTWWMTERKLGRRQLVAIIHPWETGMDNAPYLMENLKQNLGGPWWLGLAKITQAEKIVSFFRKDTNYSGITPGERTSHQDIIRQYHAQQKLRRRLFDAQELASKESFLVYDFFINHLLARANQILINICEAANFDLDEPFLKMAKSHQRSLAELVEENGQLCSWQINGGAITQPGIWQLAPLYSLFLSDSELRKLSSWLQSPGDFFSDFGLPSVPIGDPYFKARNYWQGPIWVNLQWLIIDGMKRNGNLKEASRLRKQILETADQFGIWEYYSPLDGKGAGAADFSWSAALILDLINDPV